LQVAILDVGVRRFDPLAGHERRRRTIVGADLESVFDPFLRPGGDAAARDQDRAGQSSPSERAQQARTWGGWGMASGWLAHAFSPRGDPFRSPTLRVGSAAGPTPDSESRATAEQSARSLISARPARIPGEIRTLLAHPQQTEQCS